MSSASDVELEMAQLKKALGQAEAPKAISGSEQQPTAAEDRARTPEENR